MAYRAAGVAVSWARPVDPPPNFLFQRDLFFMTPEGAVLARPGSEQRAGEARLVAAALAELGVPILASPRGEATFEGADALWLNERLVLLGVGRRTNRAGAAFVARLLAEQDVDSITIELAPRVQHLLGMVNFLDRDLAAVRADRATDELLAVLREARVEPLLCGPGPEVGERFGMNFVAVAPRRVLMPAGCPSVRAQLAGAGVAATEVEVGEYVKAAGGLGCLTGILHRAAVR